MICLFARISVHLKKCRVHESASAYEYKLVLKSAKMRQISVSNVCDIFAKYYLFCITSMYKQLNCLHFCFQQFNLVCVDHDPPCSNLLKLPRKYHYSIFSKQCIIEYNLDRIRCASAVCF